MTNPAESDLDGLAEHCKSGNRQWERFDADQDAYISACGVVVASNDLASLIARARRPDALEAEVERAETKGWQDAVSAVQYMVANWRQDRRDLSERQALIDAGDALVEGLIDAAPEEWLRTEWLSVQDWSAKLNAAQAEVESVRSARDEAIKLMTEYARQAGDAKGRLEMSELAGIVEGWQERTFKTEAMVPALEAEVERLADEVTTMKIKYDMAVVGEEKAEARVAALERGLKDVLALPAAVGMLKLLDRGFGTKTRDAVWLRARALLSDREPSGGAG